MNLRETLFLLAGLMLGAGLTILAALIVSIREILKLRTDRSAKAGLELPGCNNPTRN